MTVRDDEGSSLRRFETPSRSRPDIKHELVASLDGRVLSCSCPAWGYRRQCRHAARLVLFLDEFTEKEGRRRGH